MFVRDCSNSARSSAHVGETLLKVPICGPRLVSVNECRILLLKRLYMMVESLAPCLSSILSVSFVFHFTSMFVPSCSDLIRRHIYPPIPSKYSFLGNPSCHTTSKAKNIYRKQFFSRSGQNDRCHHTSYTFDNKIPEERFCFVVPCFHIIAG